MDRKPVFDAIAYELGRRPLPHEITPTDALLFRLGFPVQNKQATSVFARPDATLSTGLKRRLTVFNEIRRQFGTLRPLHITMIDELLTKVYFFPPAPAATDEALILSLDQVVPTPLKPLPSKPNTQTTSPAAANKTKNLAIATTLVAVIGAPAALILNNTLDHWEGNELVPYYDIVKVATNCRGNTKNVDMKRVYTTEECAIINEAASIAHATPVIKATPLLTTPTKSQATHPNQLAAAISFAYNIGTTGYATSSIDRYFDQGRWYTACDRLLLWNKAGGKVVRGLTLRRQWERDLCRTNVPIEYRK